MDATLSLLHDLIAIDSVNPALVPGAAGEAAIARRVADALCALGLRVDVCEVAPGRPNVVGVLEGRAPGRALMLCGHLDTVGVAGMAAPFSPVSKNGRTYGRGAQDMKGGLAAMLGAVARIHESGGLASGRVLVACVVDEEHASLGAEALVASHRAEAAIITEPTGLAIGVAHKGFEWVEVETRGRAAHGSRPEEGRDAIVRMGHVLVGLEALDRGLRHGRLHALVGAASVHASLIQGGRELSSYPDRCTAQIERRTLPGEAPGTALREIETLLRHAKANDEEFEGYARLLLSRPPYEVGAADELPRTLCACAAEAGAPAAIEGVSFWTDAAILGAAGIPTVLFGPGGAGLHGTEEYVNEGDVLACRDVLVECARRFTAS